MGLPISYYQDEWVTIYHGDCREILPELPSGSVDLIKTDPPYELDWRQSINFKNRKSMFHHREETQTWDRDVKLLYEWFFPQVDRLLTESGSLILFTRSEYITWAVDNAKKNNLDNKATIVWHKTNPLPQVRKKNYLSSIESILWVARYNEDKCPFTFNFLTQNEMHNFFEMPLCGGNERTEHPTQKPIGLVDKLLIIHSNIGDLILDPFLGSGTTAYCAKKLNRKCIGIEIEEKYCEIAAKRCSQGVFDLSVGGKEWVL